MSARTCSGGELERAFGLGVAGPRITWVSPLANDDYAEYRDQDFLDRLKIKPEVRPLKEFWPTRGPQWDALGRSELGAVFLVEAKANIPELVSPATAASPGSRRLIEQSLAEAKSFLRADPDVRWSGKLYQYTNRIAHLYWLCELNGVPAFLVSIYFTGDAGVNGPKTRAEWDAALTVTKHVLGIPAQHRLSSFMADIFIDVHDLADRDGTSGSSARATR